MFYGLRLSKRMSLLTHTKSTICFIPSVYPQLTSSETVERGENVILDCILSDTGFTEPEWRSPSGTIIFNQDSSVKNPALDPDYANRLSRDTGDSRDLKIIQVRDSDAGNYVCANVAKGDNTITLTVTPPTTTTGPPPQDPCPIWCIVIVIIAVVVALIVIGCIIGCCYFCCGNCKECFEGEAADCKCCQCCDNDVIRCKCCCSCFGDQKMPFWYYILWWTVIGSPVAFGIFIVSKCTKQGKEDAGKKDNAAEKQKAKPGAHSVNPHSNQETTVTFKNEHKDHGSKVRPQPSPPGGAKGTSTVHGRDGSDSAVSREDVDVQESGSLLNRRPMPDIPKKHDKKSENNDGKAHHLTSIETPEQKAGTLEPLKEGQGEESKKGKKKKKKSDENKPLEWDGQ